MSEQYFEEEEFESRFNGRTITRVLQQATPHWPLLVGFLVTIATVALVDAVFTYLSKLIIDDAIVPGDEQALVRYLAIYGVLIVVQSIGIFFFIYLTAGLGERIRYDLRKRLFNHLQELSFSYFDRTPIGWIMSRVTSDTQRIGELVIGFVGRLPRKVRQRYGCQRDAEQTEGKLHEAIRVIQQADLSDPEK